MYLVFFIYKIELIICTLKINRDLQLPQDTTGYVNCTCDILTMQTLGRRSEWRTQVHEQAGWTHLPPSDSAH